MLASETTAEIVKKLMSLGLEASAFLRSAYADHKNTACHVDRKDDGSFLTEADLGSNRLLIKVLQSQFPHIPIVSEEGSLHNAHERAQWPWYWLIDPLDGTREFVEKTDEYSINIALMKDGQPWLGAIFVPELGEIVIGGKTQPVCMASEALDWCNVNPLVDDKIVHLITSSRNADHRIMQNLISEINAAGYKVEPIIAGGARKYGLLAQHHLAIYPRYGSTSHWDTAAGQAIVEANGGALLAYKGESLHYPDHSLINPSFLGLSVGCNQNPQLWLSLFNQSFTTVFR